MLTNAGKWDELAEQCKQCENLRCLQDSNEICPKFKEIKLKRSKNMSDIIKWKGLEWHWMRNNPLDGPSKTTWYICKIRSSDDLVAVYGAKEVINGHYDAWAEVECPY